MKSNSTNKMNFFAKRPKTPAELVKAVKDLLAPGGRLDGTSGNIDGRKKVSHSFLSSILAVRAAVGAVFEGGGREVVMVRGGGRRSKEAALEGSRASEGTISFAKLSLEVLSWSEVAELSVAAVGGARAMAERGKERMSSSHLLLLPTFDLEPGPTSPPRLYL